MSELEHLKIRWIDAVGQNFEIARAAWRLTEGYEQATFDDGDAELSYMRILITKFDEMRKVA